MKRVRGDDEHQKLLFYDKLHTRNAEYTSFEDLAVERIKMLRVLENSIPVMHSRNIRGPEEDIASHFYCRLLCAQTLWSVRWFVNMEVKLFKTRLTDLDHCKTENYFRDTFFVKINGFNEKENLILPDSKFGIKNKNTSKYNSNTRIYFTKVCDLLALRKVKVEKGYCRLSPDVMKSCMTNFYRQFLEERMNDLYDHMLRNPDERLRRLHDRVFAETKPVDVSSTIEDCLKYMPPCMSILVSKFKRDRHLKYNDRQTLCRFLKECGVGVDENIQFMRSIFNVNRDVFDKEYLYGIRHNYGLEGKRANYPSFTCRKIISLSSEPNTCGCPFSNNLKGVADYTSLKGIECLEIEELAERHSYQDACTAVLTKMTNKIHVNTVVSPVDFYKEYKS